MSPRAFLGLLHSVVYAFSEKIRRLLRDSTLTLEPSDLSATLDLLQSIVETCTALVDDDELRMFLPDFFMFGFLLHRTSVVDVSTHSSFEMARKIWNISLSSMGGNNLIALQSSVVSGLKDLMMDLDARPT